MFQDLTRKAQKLNSTDLFIVFLLLKSTSFLFVLYPPLVLTGYAERMTGIDYFSEPIPIALTKNKKCSAASKCLEERKKGFLNSSCELKRCQQKNSMESYPELDTGSRAENFNGAENVSTQCRQRGVQEEKLLGFQLTASPSPPFYKQFRHGYIVAVHKK